WKPFAGKIILIRSSEYDERPWLNRTIHKWKSIAEGGLEVYTVPGHHRSLFEEPEVLGLARQIEILMSSSTTQDY
ncbi:MAG: hypothetical protein AAFU64_11290, partial [Bacteroidota bacterium]